MQAGWRDYLLLLLLSLILGASFVLTSVAVREIPPLTVVSGRLLIATVLFLVLMQHAGQRLPRGPVWWAIGAAALFGNALPFTLINWAQIEVDAGVTAIYMAVMPLGTVALAHLVTGDEKLNRLKFAGVVLGILGVASLMGWGHISTMGGHLWRELAIVMAALCYSVNAIVTRSLVDFPKRALLAAMMTASLAMVLPLALIFEAPWSLNPSPTALFTVLASGVGPTALATLMLIVIVARQGASFLSQINFLIPLFGAGLGVLFLNEQIAANAWLALALILSGIAMVRFGSAAKRSTPGE